MELGIIVCFITSLNGAVYQAQDLLGIGATACQTAAAGGLASNYQLEVMTRNLFIGILTTYLKGIYFKYKKNGKASLENLLLGKQQIIFATVWIALTYYYDFK